MNISTYSLCVIKDSYFSDFPNIRHMSNKHENRPYYLAVHNSDGIIWTIPLSSKVDKYREKIKEDEKRYGNCLFYYITKVKERNSVFLIGNVIPVTEYYIRSAFTINKVPFVIQDKNDIKIIQNKFSRYLTLVRQGKLKPSVDILAIKRVLLSRMKHADFIV